ncbi:MAG: protein-glutamate O-methyltransferase CheR [Ardenticatenales bacterium]|nr:protein-glutamate O-methyltransferase CheR [Ardenticatenales bacterium]
MLFSSSSSLSADDFEALRRLIYEQSGIWLGDTKQPFLQLRLQERLLSRNITSAREYYHFLKYDPLGSDEMQRLLDAVTINESWFFRESAPLLAWRDTILPALMKQKQPVRLWSAACSTGEEPYTLAMLLLEMMPQATLAQLEIVATDISLRALEAARTGIYDPHSLRHTEPRWVTRYFQPVANGGQRVGEAVRRLVHFGQGNLLDQGVSARVGRVDLILCRNVLIYFNEQSRQKALNNLYSALHAGSHLLLGHSETLAHTMSSFEVARVGGSILYAKPATP